MSNLSGHKIGVYAVFAMVALCGLLLLADMWFGLFAEIFLGKTLITLIVLALLLGGFLLLRRDMREEEKMRKDGYMD